jgi:TonB family protein
MTRYVFPLAVVATLIASASAHAAGDLDRAKALYAAASYDEALASLDEVDTTADPIQVNQYRALCLLALGRTRDAETPLQQIVTADPLYAVPASDVSPRLIDLFKNVRRRVLPGAARQLYTKAKASYDAKDFAEASSQFKTLLAVLTDPDVANRETSDLKDLAEGFLALASAQAAAPKPPVAAPDPAKSAVPAGAPPIAGATGAPPPPAAASLPHEATAEPPAEARIYSSADSDVKPPIEIERIMPRWVPTTAAQQVSTFRGTLRVVVSETGQVESASLLTSIYPTFNDPLLRTAKSWRYRPATRDGVPVKYALTLEIVLRPNGATKE